MKHQSQAATTMSRLTHRAPLGAALLGGLLLAANAHAAPPAFTGQPLQAGLGTAGRVLIDLRAQNIVTGTAPMTVTFGGEDGVSLLTINGQQVATELVAATASRTFGAPFPNFGTCVSFVKSDFTLGDANYTVGITVTNAEGSVTQQVAVSTTLGATVNPAGGDAVATACADGHQPPVARIAPDTTRDRTIVDNPNDGPGDFVAFNGSTSTDPDGGALTYQWQAYGIGTTPTLYQTASGPTANFRLERGQSVVVLSVIDSDGFIRDFTTVNTLQAPAVAQPPTANAGPAQTVNDTNGQPGETVTLDGTGSQAVAPATIVAYQWSIGENVIANGPTPSVALLNDGVSTITLTVTDSQQQAATSSVTIVVNAARAPVVNAGEDQSIPDRDGEPGENVTLTGTATDADGTIASYAWFVGETQLGTGPTLNTRLPDGVNVVMLRVTDNAGAIGADTVTITIATAPVRAVLSAMPNLPPSQRSTARALDRICRQLDSAAGGLNADQQDLNARCNGLYFNNTAANQATALEELTPEDFAVARTQALLFANTQYAGVSDRLAALRSGSRGTSVAGLNLLIDGRSIPLAQLQSFARALIGGAASDADEPGGLLNDKWGFWLRGNYSFGGKEGSPASPAFDTDQWALVSGVDYRFTNTLVAGLSLAYGDSTVEVTRDDGGLKTTSFALSAYGSTYAIGNFYLDAVVNVASASLDANRNIVYVDGAGLVDREAQGDTDGMTLSGGLSGGYDFAFGAFTVSPSFGVFYVGTTIDSFTESGAGGLNLTYDEQTFESLTGNLGLRASYAWKQGWGVLLPEIRAEYLREFAEDVEVFGVRFASDPQGTSTPPIVVTTDNPDTSYWRLAAGMSAQFKYGFSGYVEYQRLVGFQFIDFEDVSIGLRMQHSFK